MKPCMVTLTLALSSTALAFPFSSSSSCFGIPTPSQTSVSVPSSTPLTPSIASSIPPTGTSWITSVIGGQPEEPSSLKRADVPIRTELSSLEAEAESALGALPHAARNKRSFSGTPLPPPTVTPSGVASGFPTSFPTPTPSSVPLSVSTSF